MPQVSDQSRCYTARWIIPAQAEPIERGTIEIQNGQIVAVSRHGHPETTDLGNVALIPGLVNCHTHLEFSDQEKPVGSPDDFTQWIRAVIASRKFRTRPLRQAVQSGLHEVIQTGTTSLGEIATYHLNGISDLKNTADLVVFREIIGLLPEQFESQLQLAQAHFEPPADTHHQTSVIRGLSPHAPYSVHFDLLQQLMPLAVNHNAPVAMHLAETKEELQLLSGLGGPFAKMLMEYNLWQPDLFTALKMPLDYLKELANAPHALVIHGNYLNQHEIDFIARNSNLTVVYCPRTHAWFRHDPHPWQRLLAAGARVALGTDSRASNPDLSLFGELKFLQMQFPNVSPQQLLQLGTCNGTDALGARQHDIAAGSAANLAVVQLPEFDSGDAWTLLWHRNSSVIGTMKEGSWLHSPGEPLP